MANLEAKVSRSRKAGGELKRVRAWHDVERMSPKIGACVRTPKSESRSSIATAKPEQSNRAIFFFPSFLTGSTRSARFSA